MSKLMKIGIVGCGAIGSSLARIIVADFSDKAELSSVYDIDIEKSKKLANKLGMPNLVALSLDDLIKNIDLAIEAAKSDTVFDIAEKVISASRDIVIMSVGGVIKNYKKLEDLAREKECRIFIPSGAICGIDGLKAAMGGKIHKVTLTTKKPPMAFSGVPYVSENKIDLSAISEDTVIFEGNALLAVRHFPQNINVAAALSMAGIGPENTHVRIIASPNIKRNIHEIEIDSEAGKIFTRTENVIHPDNPKTSYLAVLSAVAVLRQVLQPIRIGT